MNVRVRERVLYSTILTAMCCFLLACCCPSFSTFRLCSDDCRQGSRCVEKHEHYVATLRSTGRCQCPRVLAFLFVWVSATAGLTVRIRHAGNNNKPADSGDGGGGGGGGSATPKGKKKTKKKVKKPRKQFRIAAMPVFDDLVIERAYFVLRHADPDVRCCFLFFSLRWLLIVASAGGALCVCVCWCCAAVSLVP